MTLLELGLGRFGELVDRFPCGGDFVERSLRRRLRAKEAFVRDRHTNTPEALYRELRAERPAWLREVPQYHIASYLGVAPETLSRIRRRTS